MAFEQLIELANSKIRTKESSGLISCGQVSAAIETHQGAVYVGVCIDTPCSIGMCAERNAIGSMVTEGNFKVIRLVCLKDGEPILPCGVCRELLMQLHPENGELEILVDKNGSTIKLNLLLPHWHEVHK